jgi:pilus assembly protein CpaE
MADQAKIRIIIVDDIAETRDNLEKLLFFEKDIEVVGKASSGREAIALARQQQPDVVLMDINMPDMDGIAATEALRDQVPTAQVIMMSVQGENDYLRRSMLAGAREFLIKPIGADELYAAIRHVASIPRKEVYVKRDTNAPGGGGDGDGPGQGQVFAVFSPKGGVGVSVVACNLAVALRQMTGKKVALVDGNMTFGSTAVIMNLVSNKTIKDLADKTNELERDLLNDVMVTHASQVKILLAPPNPQLGELVTADHLRTILEALKKEYDYIVVDTQSSFQDRALAVLDLADRIVAMMTLEMPCIRNIKLFLEVAELLEYPAEKTVLVLNKADGRLGLRVENVEEHIRHKVALQIPNALHEMTLAINQGVPIVIDKRDHPTSKGIFQLATLLANSRGATVTASGKGGAAGSAPNAKDKKDDKSKGGLFGRLLGSK